MNAPHKLIIRKIPFDFDEDIAPIWNTNKPEWSHMVNGASLTMPYLEPFLIRTMREAIGEISDDALIEDARGFIGQEGQHYQNHRAFNERLKANGYPELAHIEEQMAADYQRFQNKSLKWRLAYSAGFETMTMGLTQWLVSQRRKLFAGADPSVTSLVLWHMVEETEHKTVAFDVYQHLYGGYFARVRGVFDGSWHVMRYSHRGYKLMLKKDGRWWQLASRWRLLKMEASFLFNVGKLLLGAMLPGHHPDDISDPDWVQQWSSAYRNLAEDEIPLLDTNHPEIPARFGRG
ncbi:MAG: metal-dependent hydrolase [Parvibaculales bacterium]